ncbi:YdeI/OmpD-associated family protein [Patulibacter sp.]|uniref:YdeI/OmpD-associated family protein n=1 Tax=Patulibacter sp. TaxID=1912859 RepID=UPI00271D73D9|nr:YdeI/OmpD-associated family protein [Patulibacter sp.]MDO9406946.1 YdeI/OmpD-associated family protein [Patulibacter sp.]
MVSTPPTPDPAVRFRSTIVSGGGATTGVLVPPQVVEELGGGRQPLVAITVGSHSYRGMIATRGGRSLVSLSAENRELAGVGAGDEVDVTLALDTAPRTVEVPDDLASALEALPGARAFFDGLTASQQKGFVTTIEQAKAAETRARRVAKAAEALAAGRKRV